MNDGHFPGHLRDGIAAQIGIRTTLGSPQFVVGLATGVDRFYDTVHDPAASGGFADVQGFLWNRTVSTNNANTDFFSLGLGYRW